ncbi:peptidoglycan-binding protein [Roseivirga sp. BDSF3-8]|uniref:peptidoglycan-binding domain-containing protein n=1 Tax=Roseivirga sp. BDSF3-8 TaxID=3241598 RepID=UPI003531F703
MKPMITLLAVMDLPVVDILGMGTAGLGFLLAFLSFRMLTKEQGRDMVRQPMLFAIYIFMIFSIALCGFGLVSQPLLAKGDNEGNEPTDCRLEVDQAEKKLEECKRVNEEALTPATLALISGEYFDASMSKDSLIAQVRALTEAGNELINHRRQYAYTLFELEMQMHGQNINLRLENSTPPATIRSIQVALQGLERYNGPINGDRQATYEAVVRFQQWLNQVNNQNDSPYIRPANYGIFGFRTLEALRTQYRLSSNQG